jgi:hypothetical protein
MNATSTENIGFFIAFGAFTVSAVGLLIGLLRTMAGYGREQGEIRTAISQIKERQDGQISAAEVRLMQENTALRLDALTKFVDRWADSISYDVRRLRESHRHQLGGQVAREDARRELERMDEEEKQPPARGR